MIWLFLLAALVQDVLGQSLVYGLQAQRPPVARVGQTWAWTLLNGTFSGDSLSYSAAGLPAWASFNAQTLTFSGLPATSDLGETDVTVHANATDGASSDSFHLLVSDAPAPVIKWPLAQQLRNGTSLPEECVLKHDNSLRIPPYWSFSIGLQWNTFALPQDAFAFYTAYEKGTTSLPSWVQFDPATVTFNGVTTETGFFTIIVFGSDHYGFGDVSQTFSITVSEHAFDLVSPLPSLNTSLGATVNYVVQTTNLTIDYTPATADNITSISVDLSALPFLSYSSESRSISGQVPVAANSVQTTQIPIVFNNTYGQTLATSLNLTVMGAISATGLLSNASIPDVLLQPGQTFSEDLSSYAYSSMANYSIMASPAAAQSWLSFDAQSRVLSGTAPAATPSYGNVTVMLIARDPTSGASQNETFSVNIAAESRSAQLHSCAGLSHAGKIALGVSLGLLGAIAAAVLLYLCCRRRRRDIRESSYETEASLKGDMSPYPTEKSPLPDQPLTSFTPVSPLPEKPKIFAGMFRKKSAPKIEVVQEAFTEPRRLGLLSVVGAPTAPRNAGLGIDSPEHSFDEEMGMGQSTYRNLSRESMADSFGSEPDSTSTGSMLYTPERANSVPRRWQAGQNALPMGASLEARRSNVSVNHALPPAPSEEESPVNQSPVEPAPIVTAIRQKVSYDGPPLRDVDSRRDVRDQTSSSRHQQTVSRHIEPAEVDHAVADAETSRQSVISGAYVPVDGTPVTSAVYSPGASTIERAQSPLPAHNGLRMVSASGQPRPSIFSIPDRPHTPDQPIRHQRGRSLDYGETANVKHEPQHITIKTSAILKFVPQLVPKPLAILGSPSRSAPARATYTAYVIDPADVEETRQPLPTWLQWDDKKLEFWGIPKEADLGELHLQIIARKPPSSPKRDGRPDTPEKRLCARVIISIQPRASKIPKPPHIITY